MIPAPLEFYFAFLSTKIVNRDVFAYVDKETGGLIAWIAGAADAAGEEDRVGLLQYLEMHAKRYPLTPCAACALPCAIHPKCAGCWYGPNKTRVVYCSTDCQATHWPEHKSVCGRGRG